MKFDTMCWMAERLGWTDLQAKLRYASLLHMPGIWKVGVMTGDGLSPAAKPGPEVIKRIESDFRMPWKAVVVEDDQGCVFIERIGKDDLMVRRDIGGRGFIVSNINNKIRTSTKDIGLEAGDSFYFSELQHKTGSDSLASAVMAYNGNCDAMGKSEWSVGRLRLGVKLAGRLVNVTTAQITARAEEALKAIESLVASMTVAVWQIVLATRPGTWILKETVGPVLHKSKKIPRSHQRHRWLLITDAERDVTPHPRRAHYRHIGEDEHGNRRHTWVRACWVGSKEAEIHGSRYQVELDL